MSMRHDKTDGKGSPFTFNALKGIGAFLRDASTPLAWGSQTQETSVNFLTSLTLSPKVAEISGNVSVLAIVVDGEVASAASTRDVTVGIYLRLRCHQQETSRCGSSYTSDTTPHLPYRLWVSLHGVQVQLLIDRQ